MARSIKVTSITVILENFEMVDGCFLSVSFTLLSDVGQTKLNAIGILQCLILSLQNQKHETQVRILKYDRHLPVSIQYVCNIKLYCLKLITVFISKCRSIFRNSIYYNSNSRMVNSTLLCNSTVAKLFFDYPLNHP